MAHLHEMRDTDLHFQINPDTMEITNPNASKNKLQQGDHGSEIFTFEMPRYLDKHDTMLCDKVEVHFININVKDRSTSEGVYQSLDLAVSEEDSNIVVFTWEIRGEATVHPGSLNFRIRFACTDGNGHYTYKKHTEIFKGISVSDGIDNADEVVAEYSDLLLQWEQRLFGAGDNEIAKIEAAGAGQIEALQAEGAAQQANIVAKGQETLDTIPPEYTDMYNMAEEAMRTKADAIVVDAEGETIAVTNASDDPLHSLRIYGKTTQGADPSPDNPQELVSIENTEVSVCGKNLLDISQGMGNNFTEENGAYTLTRNGESSRFSNAIPLYIPAGTPITFSCNILEYTKSSESLPLYYKGVSGESHYASVKHAVTNTFEEDIESVSFYLQSSENVGAYIKINNVQVEYGKVATEYEPYKPVQTLAMQRTLHGIPVTAGGNYTDANGQQWIADETVYDYAANKWQHIQRIYTANLSNCSVQYSFLEATGRGQLIVSPDVTYAKNQSIYGTICNVAKVNHDALAAIDGEYYENPANIVLVGGLDETEESIRAKYADVEYLYVLATPIITELTTEEVMAFKALRTNKPNTAITNNAGAHMAVEYAADTEIFLRECQPKPDQEQVNGAINNYLSEHADELQVPSDDHIKEVAAEVLPTPGEENEGAFLQVVNGQYALVQVVDGNEVAY